MNIQRPDGTTETVKLAYPITVDGKTIDSVTVHRPTAGEVADFIRRLRLTPEDERHKIVLSMHDIDAEILDLLDDDDRLAIEKVEDRFLPQRLRASAG